MRNTFKNRVFGAAVIKSLNSNYNADFSHQPRTLPDGTVYATDKALKYLVRNYLSKNYPNEVIFYFTALNSLMQPRTLEESYTYHFEKIPDLLKKKSPSKNDLEKIASLRRALIKNLLTCLDIKLFGATFSPPQFSISLHGPVQFTHGINRFMDNNIYSEQISSPFRNSNKESEIVFQTTLGTQFKLQEGHYVHHLSVNPRNLEEMAAHGGSEGLTQDDIAKLKEALCSGATFYDSSAKAGTENELLLWVQLKEGSKLVLPSFVELVSVNEKREIDLGKVKAILEKENVRSQVEKTEIYYDKTATQVINVPDGAVELDLC